MDKDRSVYLSEAAWQPLKDYIRARLLQLAPLAADSDNSKNGDNVNDSNDNEDVNVLPHESAKAALVEVGPAGLTYEAVDTHADLRFCAVGRRILAGAPAGPDYPDNVGYCGVQLGEFFVHNQHLTAPAVQAETERLGLTKIHVRQGYTKCNLVVVRDGCAGGSPGGRPAVITSDRGVAKALSPYPIDLLLVEPGFVELPGFPYGFLGGASGSLAGEILFNGDLSAHPDCGKICRFIRENDREPQWFPGLPLRDVGSIITLL